MDPIAVAGELAESANACAGILGLLAAPKLASTFRERLPDGDAGVFLRATFDRFVAAAVGFRDQGGAFGGSDRFMRAASAVGKIPATMIGWDPRTQDAPATTVELARAALRQLGIVGPPEGWDAVEATPREP